MANRTDFFKLLMCLYLSQVMKSSLAFELFAYLLCGSLSMAHTVGILLNGLWRMIPF